MPSLQKSDLQRPSHNSNICCSGLDWRGARINMLDIKLPCQNFWLFHIKIETTAGYLGPGRWGGGDRYRIEWSFVPSRLWGILGPLHRWMFKCLNCLKLFQPKSIGVKNIYSSLKLFTQPGAGCRGAGGRCVKCAVSRVQRSVENVEGGTGILISLIRRSLNCSPRGPELRGQVTLNTRTQWPGHVKLQHNTFLQCKTVVLL